MGGSSKSSSAQTQETLGISSDGVVTGDLFQGKTVSVTNEFPDQVVTVFNALTELSSKSIDAAVGAGKVAIENAGGTVKQISENAQFSASPELSTLKSYMPVAIVGIVGISLILLMKGKK